MKDEYGNKIIYMVQHRCIWGGVVSVANYEYKTLTDKFVESGVNKVMTAEQAHRFADNNGLKIISGLDVLDYWNNK